MTREEGEIIAKEILEMDSENEMALSILKE
jgi:hypothetical protein